MKEHRKKAKNFLKSIKTVSEFNTYLDELVLKDEDKEIIRDIYIRGLSHQQIADKYNISIEKSKKIIQKSLDKVL